MKPEQSGIEPQQAQIRTKNVRKHTTPGAVNESRESMITSTHCFSTGPYEIGLEIPKSGFQQALEQSRSFSILWKNATPAPAYSELIF